MPCHVLSAPSGGHWQLCYAAPLNVLASFLRQPASPPQGISLELKCQWVSASSINHQPLREGQEWVVNSQFSYLFVVQSGDVFHTVSQRIAGAPSNNLFIDFSLFYLPAFSVLLPIPSPCFWGSSLRSSTCTKIFLSASALGGTQMKTDINYTSLCVCVLIHIIYIYLITGVEEKEIIFACICIS